MEYNEVREQRLQQLKAELLQQQKKQRKEEEVELQIEEALKIALDAEAKTRLANVRLVNKALYLKAAQAILYLYRTGKISGKISEEHLKALLKKLSEKKEMKIKRK